LYQSPHNQAKGRVFFLPTAVEFHDKLSLSQKTAAVKPGHAKEQDD
jgi:hypothetical protein